MFIATMPGLRAERVRNPIEYYMKKFMSLCHASGAHFSSSTLSHSLDEST